MIWVLSTPVTQARRGKPRRVVAMRQSQARLESLLLLGGEFPLRGPGWVGLLNTGRTVWVPESFSDKRKKLRCSLASLVHVNAGSP